MIMKLLPSLDQRMVASSFWLSLSSVTLSFWRNCSLKPALRGFFSAAGTVGAASDAATDRALGCLAPTSADADDGSFVVLVDMSPDLLRRGSLGFDDGLDDTLLDLDSSLSASWLVLLLRGLDLDDIVKQSTWALLARDDTNVDFCFVKWFKRINEVGKRQKKSFCGW